MRGKTIALEALKKAQGNFPRSQRRFRKEGQPIAGDMVVFQTICTNDLAARVTLLEYEELDGFILRQDEGSKILKWSDLGVGFVRRIDTSEICKGPPKFELTCGFSSTLHHPRHGNMEGRKAS